MPRLFEEALKERNISYQENVSTKELCTFRIGGICRYLITPVCQGELLAAVWLCRAFAVPFHILGRGSNTLFSDKPFRGALIRTTELNSIRLMGDHLVADCGASLPRLARFAATRGFGDLAFAAGIPGTLGGGARMNAGAHGECLGSLVEWVKVLDIDNGEIRTLFNKELSFSYRKSTLQVNNCVVLQACLRLRQQADSAEIAAQTKTFLKQRAASQPLDLPSAGSVFLRTKDGVSMGKIIEDLGLKGKRFGGAEISCKHGGFIVNRGGATAHDVCRLIRLVEAATKQKFGFVPQTEICFVGIEEV